MPGIEGIQIIGLPDREIPPQYITDEASGVEVLNNDYTFYMAGFEAGCQFG